MQRKSATPTLGLKANFAQFSLLVIINAFVGAMIGLERSILPAIAEQEFHLIAKAAILSFITVFGISKAITNYFAGRLCDRFGRKKILIYGWAMAIPVPLLLIWAPSWNWILVTNVFLGISQGLTWSTTVIMKIDLVGSKQRGLAMGLNEFAGYLAVAISALLTGFIADRYGLRPLPFYLGIVYVLFGLGLSHFFLKETHDHVKLEEKQFQKSNFSQWEIFAFTTFKDKNLSSITQAGLVNNLNDGMAWGLFPILFLSNKISLEQIGFLAAIYPAVWGLTQIYTGYLSDSFNRKWLVAIGMWVQAIGIVATAISSNFYSFALGGILLGLGTAMVYPTMLAAVGDSSHPGWRASAVGVYRFWRDSGYAIGAVLAGFMADSFGLIPTILTVAVITFASGIIVAVRMREAHRS